MENTIKRQSIKKTDSKVYNKVINVTYLDELKGEAIKRRILSALSADSLFAIAALDNDLNCKDQEIINLTTAMEQIEFIFKAITANIYNRFTSAFGSLYKDEMEPTQNLIARRIYETLSYFGEKPKKCFMMFYCDNYSIEEIAYFLEESKEEVRDILRKIKLHIMTTITSEKERNMFYNCCGSIHKVESIFDTLKEYNKREILEGMHLLRTDEKEVIYALHGYDLENPQTVPLNSLYLSEYELIILPRLHGFIAKEKDIKDKSLHLK